MAPQAKGSQGKATPTASAWGVVKPPRKKGREASIITEDTAGALMDALEAAADGEYVGGADSYKTKGRAVAASVRYRRALLDYELISDMKDVQSRVWNAGSDDE